MKNKVLNTDNIKAVTVEAKAFNVADAGAKPSADHQVEIRDSLDRIDKNTALLPNILQAFGTGTAAKRSNNRSRRSSDNESGNTRATRTVTTRTRSTQEGQQPPETRRRTRRTGRVNPEPTGSTESTDSTDVTPPVVNTRARRTTNRRDRQTGEAEESTSTTEATSGTDNSRTRTRTRTSGNTDNTSIVDTSTDSSNSDSASPVAEGESDNNQSDAERLQEQRQEEQRSRTLFDRIKGLATSLTGRGATAAAEATENQELNDTLGTAAGGSLYGAVKEITDVVGTAKESTFLQKGLGFARRGWSRLTGRPQESDSTTGTPPAPPPTRDPVTGRFLSRAERQSMSASALRNREREQNQDSTSDRLAENDQNEERRHNDLIRAITSAIRGVGGAGGGGSLLDSITDWFGGGGDERGNRRGGRPRSRLGRALDKGKSLLGSAGSVAKNVAGKAAVPLAGALAGFSKYSEVKDDESLTGNQKAVQVGSSATGAMGGSLAGAAAGAAIGSVVPFVGTAIGGLIGAVIGGMGGEKLGSMIGEGISNKMTGPVKEAINKTVLPEASPELSAKLEAYNTSGKLSLNADESEVLKQRQEAAKQNPDLKGDLTHYERMDLYDQQKMDALEQSLTVTAPSVESLATAKPAAATVSRIETPKPEKPIPISKPVPVNPGSSNSTTAAAKQPVIDENKLGVAIARAMEKHPQNKPVPASMAQGPILTEFDDTTLTLMAYDRI